MARDSKKCERLPLSTPTKRRLWSESGGYCQNPACGKFLFEGDADIDFAEMAHIVAATSGGPRDLKATELSEEMRAHHTNVAVLCANCHTVVDKDPDSHPISTMHEWKARHQQGLQLAFGTPEFESRRQARDFVEALLAQNRTVFNLYGPREDDFSEERAAQWQRHAVQTVVPNNAAIQRVLTQNRRLLRPDERGIADLFNIHVTAFEARHILGDRGAGSLTFPEGMDAIFEGDG
ncbi:MAG TPA: hypothetical protein VGL36_35835 [Kribbella sp.]